MQIFCFSLNFHPLMLTSLVDLAYSNYYCGVLMVIFYSFHSFYINWNSEKKNFLSNLFIWSFVS